MFKAYFLSFLIITTFSFSACINIKSEYPNINYYKLTSEIVNIEKKDTIDCALQIRNFGISDEYKTDRLLVKWVDDKETNLKVYYYHRWLAPFEDMFTDFLIKRMNEANSFTGGVLKSSTLAMPDYIIEGRILEMQSVSSESSLPGSNFIELVVNAGLMKRSDGKAGLDIVFNKTYSQKIVRRDNSIASIAEGLSKAASYISDMIMIDVQNSLDNNNQNSRK